MPQSNDLVIYLTNSAARGDLEMVKYYIESLDVEINSTDDIGRTALHRAAYEGEISIVKYLLSKGADVNSKIESANNECNNISGATPLSWTVLKGHVDIAKILIQHGAKVDVELDRSNLLGCAAASGNPLMIDYILLNYITDVNKFDSGGNTPLMIAVGNEKPESTRYLLDKGADCKKCDADGFSPLIIAVQEKNGSQCTELLLNHVKENEGNEELIKYINFVDPSSGRTALHLACMVCNYHTVKVLLEHGADYKIKDNGSREPDDLIPGDSKLCRKIKNLFIDQRLKNFSLNSTSGKFIYC